MDLPVDDRFSHIGKDPRFRMMPKQDRKVKIDRRFQDMFKNKQFKLKYSVDKRGRPVNQSSSENLKQFYELSDDSDDDDADDNVKKSLSAVKVKREEKRLSTQSLPDIKRKHSQKKNLIELLKRRKERLQQKALNNTTEQSTTGEEQSKKGGQQTKKGRKQNGTLLKKVSDESDDSDLEFDPLGVDVARGMGNVESSSESESESEEELEHDWGELDVDAPRNENTSRRIAVCNVDWDRVKAADLMAVFNSFKPTGGLVHSVKIYPSEYGLQKMQDEDRNGPTELLQKDDKEIDYESLEGQKIQMERLRTYQLQRLRYYYAVVECDSAQTAIAIYDHCDNLELESSSTKLDLRFIPDDVTFDNEPTSQVTDAGDITTYKPAKFKTTALHQSKVVLTWDETDKERSRIMQRAFESDEFNEKDLNTLIASSDDDDDEDERASYGDDKGGSSVADDIAKYRSLLKEVNEAEKKESENNDMEMEITWETGLKEATEELVKRKLTAKEDDLTPWERYLKKRKEKKMEKIESRQKKKAKPTEEPAGDLDTQMTFSDDELPEGVDLSDSFFSQSLSGGDMSDQKGKKKRKRKKKDMDMTPEELQEKERKKAELELLMMGEDDGKKHFSMDSILENEQIQKNKKKKKKKMKTAPFQDDFEIDVKDKRFNALFTSHHFAVDPSDPNFKRTKAMDALIQEKQKRRDDREKNLDNEIRKTNQSEKMRTNDKEELSMLVKSIKNKTDQFHQQKVKKKGALKHN